LKGNGIHIHSNIQCINLDIIVKVGTIHAITKRILKYIGLELVLQKRANLMSKIEEKIMDNGRMIM
jgi:hypothetical protein